MKHSLTIRINTVILKPLEIDYIESLRILRNQAENRRWFKNDNEITKEEQARWYEKYLKTENDYMFAVFECHDFQKNFIGAVALYNIDRFAQSAEFGRIIIDKARASRKGLGYISTIGACMIGFDQLGLREIALEVFPDNISAIKTYEKVGFKKSSENKHAIFMKLSKEKFKTLLEVSDKNGNSII